MNRDLAIDSAALKSIYAQMARISAVDVALIGDVDGNPKRTGA